MAVKAQSKAPAKAAKNMPAPPIIANLDDEDDMEESESLTPSPSKPGEGASPMTPKNFRNHPDMENFFRFINDNDLRLEALQIIDEILEGRRSKKAKK